MKKKQNIEKLIEQYEKAESDFHDAEYQIDKHHDFEGVRKFAHDKMITLGHKIMSAEKEIAKEDLNYKKDYFTEKQAEEKAFKDSIQLPQDEFEASEKKRLDKKATLNKEQIVDSDLSWEEKKRLFKEIHAEEEKGKKEKSHDLDFER